MIIIMAITKIQDNIMNLLPPIKLLFYLWAARVWLYHFLKYLFFFLIVISQLYERLTSSEPYSSSFLI